MITLDTVLSITGILIAVVSLYLVRRDRADDTVTEQQEAVKAQENRITVIEQKQEVIEKEQEQYRFTAEDRQCLNEVKMKIDLFWTIVEREFPRLLVQENTPKLDILLEKAGVFGFQSLAEKEKADLEVMLDDEYSKALHGENSGRAMAIAFYKATVQYRRKVENGEHC